MVVLALGLMMATPASAQTDKQQKKENKEWQKKQEELRKFVNEKAGKEAQKQAKKLEREGWKSPISLPIAKQLERTWMKMAEEDAKGDQRYIYVSEEVTANTFGAAQSNAVNLAKLRIASQIKSSIAALVDISLANRQINEKEAESYHNSVETAKVIVSEKLGLTFTPMEIYRVLSNGNYQVQIVMFYDMKTALETARGAILEELKKDADVNKAQLESIMGLDKIMEQVAKDLPTYDEIVK